MRILLLVILIVSCAEWVRPQTPAPTLLTEQNSQRAIALDSATFVRDPLAVVTRNNFSQNRRTSIALFGHNMDLLPGENASAVTVRARDSRSRTYNLSVEFVGKIPNLDFTQVVAGLPDELAQAGDVWLSVSLRGQTSNEVLFNIEVQTEPRRVTVAARKANNFADAVFSFEFGVNGDSAVQLTLNDWDIQFGNTPGVDSFNVSMAGDDCSRIQDMGALDWTDAFQVPVLTAHPVPTIEPEINAIVGHMYVVHTKDRETNLYALFRVESLQHGVSVTISWKSVQSPE